MTLRAFPMLNDLSDSLFADRFNRIDRLFSQLTGSTPLPSTPSYNIRRVGDNRYELLAIELHQDIPEEEKPQRIAINNNPAIEHKP